MLRRKMVPRLQLVILLLLFAMVLALPAASILAAQASTASIPLLRAEGPVTPALAGYLERGIEAAEQDDVPLLVVLNTPGGSVETTQKIIRLFRNAQVPVLVYVGPAGAQAASAGSLITLAAHASGMAPETVIGAASPVGGEGQDVGDTLYRKLVEDLKATARSLAASRGEEAVALAQEMIEDARAVNAREALDAGLIDVVATDPQSFLAELDGKTVTVGEETWQLQTDSVEPFDFEMSLVESVLHAVSNPLLISILLPLGLTSILIELKSPGGWVPGFIGVVSLGLGLYGLGQLPVNWLGLGLVVVAFALFLLEVKAPGIGALALAGGASLLAGLLLLFNSPGTPEFASISLSSAIATTAVTSALFLFIVGKAVAAQRRQPVTGREGLVGDRGRVRKTLTPLPSGKLKFGGSVLIHGEIWRAQADEAIKANEEVVVTGVDGFTLKVKRPNGA